MRGADPAIVLVPGVGMFSFGANKQTARVAGEFYVNAINVMRGAEAVSTYAPIDESEKFRIEYWALEEAKLARMPKPKPLATRVALVTGAASRHRQGDRRPAGRRGRLRRRRRPRPAEGDRTPPPRSAAPTSPIGVAADVSDAEAVAAAFRAAALAFGGVDLVVNNAGLSISKPLLETTEQDWDLQHDVMAKGSFLVSREAARIMIEQGLGGDIVYISSEELAVRRPEQHRLRRDQGRPGAPGPAAGRRARPAPDPGQRHQPRRRRPRVGHLRRRLGRQPGRRLRGRGGQARRVLRPAHPAQARGAARPRRRRRLRADRWRPHPDDGPARAGRLRRRRRLPPVRGRWP